MQLREVSFKYGGSGGLLFPLAWNISGLNLNLTCLRTSPLVPLVNIECLHSWVLKTLRASLFCLPFYVVIVCLCRLSCYTGSHLRGRDYTLSCSPFDSHYLIFSLDE